MLPLRANILGLPRANRHARTAGAGSGLRSLSRAPGAARPAAWWARRWSTPRPPRRDAPTFAPGPLMPGGLAATSLAEPGAPLVPPAGFMTPHRRPWGRGLPGGGILAALMRTRTGIRRGLARALAGVVTVAGGFWLARRAAGAPPTLLTPEAQQVEDAVRGLWEALDVVAARGDVAAPRPLFALDAADGRAALVHAEGRLAFVQAWTKARGVHWLRPEVTAEPSSQPSCLARALSAGVQSLGPAAAATPEWLRGRWVRGPRRASEPAGRRVVGPDEAYGRSLPKGWVDGRPDAGAATGPRYPRPGADGAGGGPCLPHRRTTPGAVVRPCPPVARGTPGPAAVAVGCTAGRLRRRRSRTPAGSAPPLARGPQEGTAKSRLPGWAGTQGSRASGKRTFAVAT